MDKFRLGIFLAQLRNEKGLTQEQVATMVNVTYKTVSKWECGNALPSLDTLAQLAEIYDVSLYEMSIYEKIKSPFISKNNIKKVIDNNSIIKFTIIKILILIISICMILFTVYSCIYIVNNYGKMEVFELESEDPNLSIKGICVKAFNSYYLSIDHIDYAGSDEEFSKNKTKMAKYLVKINGETEEEKYKEFNDYKNIGEALNFLKISISDKSSKENINDVYLILSYLDRKDYEHKKEVKISLSSKYKNSKLFP